MASGVKRHRSGQGSAPARQLGDRVALGTCGRARVEREAHASATWSWLAELGATGSNPRLDPAGTPERSCIQCVQRSGSMADAPIDVPKATTTSELQFESRLESICANLEPASVATFLARRFRDHGDPSQKGFELAPHYVSRMICGACAYYRRFRCRAITQMDYAKLHNLLVGHSGDYLQDVLVRDRDIHRTFVAMVGEQLHFQERIERSDYFRLLHLLSQSPRMDKHQQVIADLIGGCVKQVLVFYSYLITYFGSTSGVRFSCREFDAIANAAFPDVDWKRALSHMTQTCDECGAEYRRRREEIRSSKYKGLARSPLMEKPVLAVSDGQYAAPIPRLVERWVMRELQNLVMQLSSSIAEDIRLGYEEYVGKWLESTATFGAIIGERDIPMPQDERVCDFLCDGHDAITLVEVKSSSVMPPYLIVESLRGHTVVRKSCDGINQLSRVAERLRQGRLGDIRLGGRRLYGVVVVLGTLPGINNEFSRAEMLGPRYQDIGFDPDDFALFDQMPQVMDNRDFERVCSYLSGANATFSDLWTERLRHSYAQVGGWEGLAGR